MCTKSFIFSVARHQFLLFRSGPVCDKLQKFLQLSLYCGRIHVRNLTRSHGLGRF